MDADSTLETVAEIAVTLTGFAGIAGALAGEKLRPNNRLIWLSFWVLISTSICTLFVALFPFLPHYLGASDNVAWAASSGVVTIVTACNLAFFLPAIRRAKRDGSLAAIPVFEVPLNLVPPSILVSQILNALGIGLRQGAGGFLIGLYLLLLLTALNFVQLLYVLDRTPESRPAA